MLPASAGEELPSNSSVWTPTTKGLLKPEKKQLGEKLSKSFVL